MLATLPSGPCTYLFQTVLYTQVMPKTGRGAASRNVYYKQYRQFNVILFGRRAQSNVGQVVTYPTAPSLEQGRVRRTNTFSINTQVLRTAADRDQRLAMPTTDESNAANKYAMRAVDWFRFKAVLEKVHTPNQPAAATARQSSCGYCRTSRSLRDRWNALPPRARDAGGRHEVVVLIVSPHFPRHSTAR